MKSGFVKWTTYKITLLLTAVVLIFSACRPGPAVPRPTQAPGTPGPAEASPTAACGAKNERAFRGG